MFGTLFCCVLCRCERLYQIELHIVKLLEAVYTYLSKLCQQIISSRLPDNFAILFDSPTTPEAHHATVSVTCPSKTTLSYSFACYMVWQLDCKTAQRIHQHNIAPKFILGVFGNNKSNNFPLIGDSCSLNWSNINHNGYGTFKLLKWLFSTYKETNNG